ncbi:MAG: hypothetical protein ACOC8F_01315 [Planctomycetota bacterium]
MWNVLKWLFDFDAPDIRAVEGVQLHYGGGDVLLTVLAGLVVVGLVAAVVTYVRTTEVIRTRNRFLFGGLRCLAYVGLAIALSAVTLVLDLTVAEKPRTCLMVDDTLSMGIRADGGDGGDARRFDRVRALLASESLAGLRGRRIVDLRRLSEPGGGAVSPEALKPTAPRTDLPAAMERWLDASRGARYRELILITDGASTVTPDYQSLGVELKRRGVRLYPVLMGEDGGLRDVSLTSVRCSPYCRAYDRLAVSYAVRGYGYDEASTVVEVVDAAEPDKVLQSRRIGIRPGAVRRGTLSVPPLGRAGDVKLLVRVRPLPDERIRQNNRSTLLARIVDEPIKVLYIDNFPRFEFLHVKWSLDRDPNIALTTLNRMPGGGWLVQGSEVLLENPESGFPDDLGQLVKYDVLILGSISRGYFSAGDARFERKLSNIARFVSGRGGGLIVLGGHRSYGQGKYRGSPLDPLLPFEIPSRGKATYITDPVQAELTALGQFHPVVQLAESPRTNRDAWDELPALSGCNVVGTPRPGSEVLAVADEEVDGRKPILLAGCQYGYGRVLASTAYSTYLWRLGTPIDKPDPLKRFWRQAVRYVAPDPRLQADSLNINLGGNRYTAGGAFDLVSRPLDGNYEPITGKTIHVDVTAPDGRTTAMVLRDHRSAPGIYRGGLELTRPGTYEIHADDGGDLTSTFVITAERSTEEYVRRGGVDAELAATAAASGGRVVPHRQVEDFLAELAADPRISSLRVTAPLWASPALLLVLVGVCATEWFLRKRCSLA